MTSDHVQQRIVILLAEMHEAVRNADWPAVRARSEDVLRLNPFNNDAHTCWLLARDGGMGLTSTPEARIAEHLERARAALEAGDWEAVGRECRAVREIDPDNAEAEAYFKAAEEAILRLSRPPKRHGRQREQETPHAPDGSSRDGSESAWRVTRVAVACTVLAHLLAAGFYLWGAQVVSRVGRGEAPVSDGQRFDDLATFFAYGLVLLLIATGSSCLFWLYRLVRDLRSLPLPTSFSAPASVAICLLLGPLGCYIVVRGLVASLRDRPSPGSEAIALTWLLLGAGGLALGAFAMQQPAGYDDWARLLRISAASSVLIAAAGIAFLLSLRTLYALYRSRSHPANAAPAGENAPELAAA